MTLSRLSSPVIMPLDTEIPKGKSISATYKGQTSKIIDKPLPERSLNIQQFRKKGLGDIKKQFKSPKYVWSQLLSGIISIPPQCDTGLALEIV